MSEANKIVRQITPKEIKARLDAGDPLTLIDVREDYELEIASIPAKHIPKDEILQRISEVPRSGDVVIFCRSGGRSQAVVTALQSQLGFTNLFNMQGGILRWADEVDSTLQKY